MNGAADHITEIVAIDGPAGAGKSTVARETARRLNFAFLDTGAMYRAATWWALHKGLDLAAAPAEALAETTRALPLALREEDGRLRVLVDGQDVSSAIRTPDVTRCVFYLDQNPDVRAHLTALQRRFGARRPTVAEGRDMGTVVFPKAKCKIYLDASLEERARRRAADLQAAGTAVDLDTLCRDIAERDRKSMTRAAAPLRQAHDAQRVDTTGRAFEDVVQQIVALAREAM